MQITAAKAPETTVSLKTGMKPNPLASQAPVQGLSPSQTPAPVAQQATQQASDQNLQAMARREQLMREEQRAWARERDELKAKLQKFEQEYVPKSELIAKPYETITGLGVDYSKITQDALSALNSQDPLAQHIKSLEDKIASLESGFSETKSSIEKAQEQAYQDALVQINSDAIAAVKARGESDFELLATSNAAPRIASFIERVFQKGLPSGGENEPALKPGTILAVEDAAKMLEDFQLEEIKKMLKTKKVQSLLSEFFKAVPQQTAGKPAQSPTITNSMVASQKPLTARERAIRAVEEARRAARA